MPYCTSSDIANLIGTKTLAELSTDTVGSETPNPTVVSAMILQADTLIDAKCGQVYTVPFGTVPQLIKTISTNLAIYFLFSRRFIQMEVPKQWQEIKKQMDEMLESISNEELYLPSTVTVASAESSIVPRTDLPETDFYNADNYLNDF